MDGAVGEVEPGVGRRIVASVTEVLIFKGDGLAAEDAADEGSVGFGDLRKCLEDREAERGWVTSTDERDIGVVVEQDKFGTPLNGGGESAAKHGVHDGAQAFGPGFDWTEWGCGPIVHTDALCHLARTCWPHNLRLGLVQLSGH